MNLNIDDTLYDTEKLAEWSTDFPASDFSNETETLYRKKDGQLVLHGCGEPFSEYGVHVKQGWTYGEDIKLLTVDEAKCWAKNKLTVDEYKKVFDKISEGDKQVSVTLYFEHDVWKN